MPSHSTPTMATGTNTPASSVDGGRRGVTPRDDSPGTGPGGRDRPAPTHARPGGADPPAGWSGVPGAGVDGLGDESRHGLLLRRELRARTGDGGADARARERDRRGSGPRRLLGVPRGRVGGRGAGAGDDPVLTHDRGLDRADLEPPGVRGRVEGGAGRVGGGVGRTGYRGRIDQRRGAALVG